MEGFLTSGVDGKLAGTGGLKKFSTFPQDLLLLLV